MKAEESQSYAHARPLLTIAIPTYNRAAFLRELLAALFDQLVAEPRIELFISDNASPDQTPALIDEYRELGLSIRSIRNENNIGPDANFLQCFEQARGRYVWIFGDDDIIIPGALAAILSYLEAREYDLVYVSSFPLKGQTRYAPLGLLKPRAFQDIEPFVKRIHVNFTFISSNIVNKDRVQEAVPASFSALLGSNLVQLAWIYAALNTFRLGLFIPEKLVGARVDNTGGYKLTEVFGSKLKRVTDIGLRSDRVKRLIMSGTLQRFWPGLLIFVRRSTGAFESDPMQAQRLTTDFGDNPRYWFFVYPILVLPAPLGKVWLLFVRIVNRIDKALGFVL